MERKTHQSSVISCLILTLLAASLYSQDMEDLWESAGDDPSIGLYFESLQQNPIDLNSATTDRLQDALFLDRHLVNAIIMYRNQHYPLQSAEEIRNVTGMSLELYDALQPYITVQPVSQPVQFDTHAVTRFYRRYPRCRGFSEGVYQGDPWGASTAVLCSRGNLSLGGVVQKDAGEILWNDHQALFLRADNLFHLENRLVIGSYRVSFGQGLVISNGFRLSSSTADPTAILPRQALGVREFHSTSETNYFQGAAFEQRLPHLSAALFASRAFRDASRDDSGNISAIQSSGLHRTAFEDANRDQLREDLWGGHLEYNTSVASIGVTGYHSAYQPSIGVQDSVTQHFDFDGGANTVIGVHGGCQLGNAGLAGEIAWSDPGGKAFLVEGRAEIATVQTSCIYRKYDRDFHNYHTLTLTEWGEEAQNEEGWLLAVTLPLWTGARLAARTDIVQTPWRTYALPLPRHGSDAVVSFDQKLARRHTFLIRFRGSDVENLYQTAVIHEIRTGVRLQWDWQETRARSYRLRWEQIRFDTPAPLESGSGWMLYGQMTASSRRLSGKLRALTFDVPVYGARIYAYEDDVPGRLVNQLFYGRGRRLSARLKWSFASQFDLWLKLGTTFYDGVNSVGSGWDEIPSHRIYDVSIALQWRLSEANVER